MRVTVKTIISGLKQRGPRVESDDLKIGDGVGTIRITGSQHKLVSESNGGESRYATADIELEEHEFKKLFKYVFENHPEWLPGIQNVISARRSLDLALDQFRCAPVDA